MIHPGDDIKAVEDCLACDDPVHQEVYAWMAGIFAGKLGNDTCPFKQKNLVKQYLWGYNMAYKSRQEQLI